MKKLFQSNPFLLSSSALLLGFSWFPTGIFPLIFIAFVPLLIYLDKAALNEVKPWKVFLASFLVFAVFNLITSWWIYNAGGITGLLAPIIVNGILMSLTISLQYGVRRKLDSKFHALVFIGFWIAMEYLHSLNWDLSWPWLFLGNSLSPYPLLYQFYEFTGVRGGSLWILLVNVGIYKWLRVYLHADTKIGHVPFVINNLLRVVVPILFSLVLFNQDFESTGSTKVRIVQPNIDPYTDKFDESKYSTHESLLRKLSFEKSENFSPDIVLLPETSFPKGEWEENIGRSYLINSFDKLRKKHKVKMWLTGISTHKRMQYEGVPPIAAREMRDGSYYEAYNSALALSDNGRQIYHKSRLVAGVEQVPFLGSLPFLRSLAMDLGGASGTLGTQEERSVMKVDSVAIAPIICYESVYGEYVTDFVLNGANLLSIITNDAWWGDTPGYQQHFHYARLRAVENRRCIIRSANTGISGVIDPYGKVQASLLYDVDGRIDEEVELYSHLTFFTKYGDVLGRLCLLLVVYLFLVSKVKKYQRIRLDS